MPIYTYQCSECEHHFEKFLKMDNRKQPEGEPCPNCGKQAVTQKLVMNFKLIDPVRLGRVKPDGDWCNHLQNMKKNTPGAADFNTFR